MGEIAGRALDNYNTILTEGEDMAVARDIAKRFEQLESQWLRFQKRSEVWDGETQTRSTAEPRLPRNCELGRNVPSTAFSYSNPLFSSHKSIKRRSAGNSPRALSAARSSISLLTSCSSDKVLSTRHKQRLPMLSRSEKHSTVHRENFIDVASNAAVQPAIHSPSRSSLSSKRKPSASEKCADNCEIPQVSGTVAAPSSVYEAASQPFPSSPPVFTINAERQIRSPFLLGSLLDSRNCGNPDYTSSLPIRECASISLSSSLHSPEAVTNSNPPTQDPATYSSGKGPPGLLIPRMMEELGSTEVAQSSRSPPPVTPSASSARDTDLHSDGSTVEPGSNVRGSQLRNQSVKMPVNRRVSSEGVTNGKSYPGQIIPEDRRGAPERTAELAVTNFAPLLSGKMLKSDIQLDWKDRKEISALVQHKLDHTVSKVEWELRLSNRESKLRMAEEMLLEEQEKLSEARLALSKCEDILSQREEAVNHLEQQRDLAVTLQSIETGTMVMGKLVAALRDVLVQMERKERGLLELWTEFKQSSETGLCQDYHFGVEPNQSRAVSMITDPDGINVLAADGDCKGWCKIVTKVCERLVDFLARETHLQKWAVVLERESLRIKNLEEEFLNTKEATAEQFERAAEMMRCAEEQTRMAEEERATLSKERESLTLWVNHLQERRKAVTECEREAASSLAEVQKKAANLFVHESSIDGKALEISALQEELWATSMRLHDDQELVDKERLKVQERLRQISVRERDAESQLQGIRRLKEELETQKEQFEKDKVTEGKKRERAHDAQLDMEDRLNARELTVREIESELEEKALAAESLASQLNDREKILKSMHEHCELERLNTKELIADLEKEKKRIKDAEAVISGAQASKKNADEAWARVAKERREADEYLKSVEERVKAWEDRLRMKERELQLQQFSLREIENRIQEEQDRSQSLHGKLILEQETWTEELKAKQESLAKRTKILEKKETEIKGDLEKLTEERRLAISEIKRFAEMEARAWAAERELQTKQDQHEQEVREHEKGYQAQLDELEVARCEVEREFEEVHTKRNELQIWQCEAEETLQSRIDSFVKGKEELQSQIQELKKLQLDIEQAGSQVIDRVAELDQASSKLELQRSKVEMSKGKLEALARTLGQQQESVRNREISLSAQEDKIASALADVKNMTAETASKEKNVRLREQAIVDSERDLQEIEARLTNERRDLEKMIAEVEQHAATLREETVSAKEITHKHSQEQLLIQKKQEDCLTKEKELAAYEGTLKSKALSLEEHSQALAKLEQRVHERLQRAQDIEKGWEQLKEEQAAFESQREAFTNQKEEAQHWKAEQDRKSREDAQRKARLREELDRQKTEMLSKLREREHTLNLRESRVAEKETSIQLLESQGKNHIHKDAQEFRSQLNGARAELDAQIQYVEEKRRVAEAIAAAMVEREAKLKVKEKEVERREAAIERKEKRTTSFAGIDQQDAPKRPAIDLQIMHDLQEKRKSWLNGKEKFQDESLYRMVTFDLANNLQDSSSQGEAPPEREKHNSTTKHEDEVAKQRLKQMEDTLQRESTKIMQEKANLQVQHKELEETRKAVQDVKVTLTAQLKATKQMVEDAAITAQNASREREALEEERRRLEKAQKETENSLAAKEAKLLHETEHLDNLRRSLFHEKTQAMEVLQKAARAVEKERVKAMEMNVMQKERKAEAEFKEREKELTKTAELLHMEKVNLQGEKARLKMLHEVLERGKHEQYHVPFEQSEPANAKEIESRKLLDQSGKWRDEKMVNELHSRQHVSEIHNTDVNKAGNAEEFNVGFYKNAMNSCDLGTHSTSSSRGPVDYLPSPTVRLGQHDTGGNNTSWDDLYNGSTLLSSPESGAEVVPRVHQMLSEIRTRDRCDHLHEENVPSKKRLDNVMTSLLNARQASRSRLQRTENALLGVPPSSPFTTQVQQALNALSARLSLMEQIEDGLSSHLRKAYEVEYPESDGVIVDKVQLLSRMEEQQSLRAEWEEDMQQQLETISMLQATAGSTSTFTTPVRGSDQLDIFPITFAQTNWLNAGRADPKLGKCHEIQDSGIIGIPGITTTNSCNGGPNPSQQYQSPEWRPAYEQLLGVDSGRRSFSSVVDNHYSTNSGENSHPALTAREHGGEKFARRKLHLTPSINAHCGAQ